MLYPFTNNIAKPARVVVTGAGIITSHGIGWAANAEAFRTGRQSFKEVSLFDVSKQRTSIAGEVTLPETFEAGSLTKRQCSRLGRPARMLLLAVKEALAQCGWKPRHDLRMVVATTSGGMSLGEDFLEQSISRPASRAGQPTRVVWYQPQTECAMALLACGFSGTITIISNACASGANAIGHAFELVRSDSEQQVITGGYDGLCRLTFAGFDSLQALSRKPCTPFETCRDGLNLGEGAAILALENLDHALARGATILGEIIGYGASTDTHHLTQPHPNGGSALRSMQLACESAGVSAKQIDYINAHGTATVQNDAAEANAINRFTGDRSGSLRVSSTKAGIGHLLGAAGAVETVVCLMAMEGQWLPPQKSDGDTDPLCQFQIVKEETHAEIDYALTNSFGFGGANASLVVRRFQ